MNDPKTTETATPIDYEQVTVSNGKYTLRVHKHKFECLRYGEPWRDLTGDGMVNALFHRVQELEAREAELAKALKSAKETFGFIYNECDWESYVGTGDNRIGIACGNANTAIDAALQSPASQNNPKETKA